MAHYAHIICHNMLVICFAVWESRGRRSPASERRNREAFRKVMVSDGAEQPNNMHLNMNVQPIEAFVMG